MNIHVINLERSPERRAAMEASLRATRLDAAFFPAVDASRPQPLIERLHDPRAATWIMGRPLLRGELGCFASHFSLWRQCAADAAPIVVMEDDILLDERFADVLLLAEGLLGSRKLVRLSGLFERPYRQIEPLPGGYRLVRFLRGPRGTQCYALSPQGAADLVRHAQRWATPVDIYLDQFWRHQVDSLAVLPFRVRQAAGVASTIAESAAGQRPRLLRRLTRETARTGNEILRVAYNLRRGGASADDRS